MKNLPFEPLYGGSLSKKQICEEVVPEKEQRIKKKIEFTNDEKTGEIKADVQKEISAVTVAAPTEESNFVLSGYNQFAGFIDNKKLIIIAIVIILLVVAIIALIYKQKKQSKAIAMLARRVKQLRAAK